MIVGPPNPPRLKMLDSVSFSFKGVDPSGWLNRYDPWQIAPLGKSLPAAPVTAYDSSFHLKRLAEACRRSWIPGELAAADQTKRCRAADQTPRRNCESTRQRKALHPVISQRSGNPMSRWELESLHVFDWFLPLRFVNAVIRNHEFLASEVGRYDAEIQGVKII